MVIIVIGAVKAAQVMRNEWKKDTKRKATITPVEGSAALTADRNDTSYSGSCDWWQSHGQNGGQSGGPGAACNSDPDAVGAWSRTTTANPMDATPVNPASNLIAATSIDSLFSSPSATVTTNDNSAPLPTVVSLTDLPPTSADAYSSESTTKLAISTTEKKIPSTAKLNPNLTTGRTPQKPKAEPTAAGSFLAEVSQAPSATPPSNDMRRKEKTSASLPPNDGSFHAAIQRRSVPTGKKATNKPPQAPQSNNPPCASSIPKTNTPAQILPIAAQQQSALPSSDTRKRYARQPRTAKPNTPVQDPHTTGPTFALTSSISSAGAMKRPVRTQRIASSRGFVGPPGADADVLQAPAGMKSTESCLAAPGALKKRNAWNTPSRA